MLELVSVTVKNFRSFGEAEFAPLGIGQGMTAINGSNGAGKSSLVHALVWACFGVTPDGVPVRALRRQGSEGDVEARVVLRHDGQTIEVVRGLRGRNDTTIAAISVDGVEQTNISAKTATAWITNRLGLDAEAFLTAFVVRQKELDALVKARPADRRKTVERLAGIERMSAALDLARQDARAAKRLLDALPAADDPADTQAALAAAEAAAEAAQQIRDTAAAAADTMAQAARAAEDGLTAARAVAAERAQAETALSYARASAEHAAVNVATLTGRAEGADDLPHAEAAADDARAARAEAEAAVRDLDAILARAAADADRLSAAEGDQGRAKARHDAVAARLRSLPPAADIATLDAAVGDAAALVEELTSARGAERGEWDRLSKAIATLRAANEGHAATCPTCDHELADPEALIAAQETLLGAAAARGQDIAERLATATTTHTTAVTAAQAARAAEAERKALTDQVVDLAAALQAADQAVDRAAEAAETSAEAAHEAQLKASAATANLDALRAEEERAEAALEAAQAAARAADLLVDAAAAKEAADAAAADAAAALAAFDASPVGDVHAFEAAATEASYAAAQAREAAADARTATQLAARDTDVARDAHTRAVAAAEGRKSALADVERTAAAAAALEEFRRDRLARLAPELSEVASDFVARMTEGRYTAVELDEDFTPVLTEATGAQRPAAWLSGGEESAVALALRVAIGEVLSGQRGGLLILDEVLTAQDASRRSATMAAIRALPRQTITINHVSEATDMVDLVAEVVPDSSDGSTIATYSPDHIRAGDLDEVLADV
jgi:exonuclease SbcC